MLMSRDDWWTCEECGREVDPESLEDKHFTDDYEFVCEDCWCDKCNRPESKCICDKMNGDDLELDTDYEPNYTPVSPPEVDLDALNEKMREVNPEIQEFHSALELINWYMGIKAYQLMEDVCHFTPGISGSHEQTLESCAEQVKQSAKIGALSETRDSLCSTTGVSNVNINMRHIQNLLNGDKINAFFQEHFKWDYDKKWNKDFSSELTNDFLGKIQKDTEEYVKLLKEKAVEAGYTKEDVDKITVTIDMSGTVASKQASGKTNDTNIQLAYEDTHHGKEFARTITHEFQHALDNLWKNENSISGLRYRTAARYYDSNMENNSQTIAYYTNIIERTAYQAEYQIAQNTGEYFAPQFYLINHYGNSIMPSLMEWYNASTGFSGESLLFINILSKTVPELAMIPADFKLENIKELDPKDIDNQFNSEEYFYRIQSQNGNYYIIPTPKYLVELQQASGFSIKDYTQAVWEYLSAPSDTPDDLGYGGVIKELVNDSKFHGSPAKQNQNGSYPKTTALMTADTFMGCVTIAELIKIYNENEQKLGLVDEIQDKMDELEAALEVGAEVENLSIDLENLYADAESLRGELSELMDDYTQKADEYESAVDGISNRLEVIAREYRDELNHKMDDLEDLEEADLDDIKEELESEYESEREEVIADWEAAYQDYADELEELADTIEQLSSEFEDLMNEIEDLSSEIEEKTEELEECEDLAEELEELEEAINENGESCILSQQFDCRIEVCVLDQNDQPVIGIPVTAIDPNNNVEIPLGVTDFEGYVTAAVDAETYSGWTLVAPGRVTTLDSCDTFAYKSKKANSLTFVVKMEENEPVFAIEKTIVLDEIEQVHAVPKEKDASLRVTIRGNQSVGEKLPSAEKGAPDKNVTWREYYDFWLSSNPILSNGRYVSNIVFEAMTTPNAEFYGAYLIPLSDCGELPRTNGQVIFSPLYQYKYGMPQVKLVDSDDFSLPTRDNTVPYISKAFDFGTVPPGRYELAIIMPFTSCGYHFEEINIAPGENKKVTAERWNEMDNPTSEYLNPEKNRKNRHRYKTISLSSGLYTLAEKHVDQLSDKNDGTTFALAIDARGKALWSVVQYSSGEMMVPAYYGWQDSGWLTGSEGDTYEQCVGQIYLLFSQKRQEYNILPVTYTCMYLEYNDEFGKCRGRLFKGFIPGKIYCELLSKETMSNKTYVAFWEQYQDAKGNIHYRTYKGSVPFELHWVNDKWIENVQEEVHVADAVSDNTKGVLTNYLYQRKLKKKGASYTFFYSHGENDISKGALLSSIPASTAAEPITMKDTLWASEGISPGLTGEAMMKTYRTDKNGNKVQEINRVEPTIHKGQEGTAIRFIIGEVAKTNNPGETNDKPPVTSFPVVTTEEYTVNRHSLKFHKPSCGSCKIINAENRSYAKGNNRHSPMTVKQTLMVFGYVPCGKCVAKKR